MERALLEAAGLLVAGAITPGPNNFVVLREAGRGGWRGAASAILGIVAGGLAILALASFGVGAGLAAEPRLVAVAAVAGCAYLVVLGVRLLAACLALWSSAGVALERWLHGGPARVRARVWARKGVDPAMGLLLVVSAVLLIFDLWR